MQADGRILSRRPNPVSLAQRGSDRRRNKRHPTVACLLLLLLPLMLTLVIPLLRSVISALWPLRLPVGLRRHAQELLLLQVLLMLHLLLLLLLEHHHLLLPEEGHLRVHLPIHLTVHLPIHLPIRHHAAIGRWGKLLLELLELLLLLWRRSTELRRDEGLGRNIQPNRFRVPC